MLVQKAVSMPNFLEKSYWVCDHPGVLKQSSDMIPPQDIAGNNLAAEVMVKIEELLYDSDTFRHSVTAGSGVFSLCVQIGPRTCARASRNTFALLPR
jgi:hypothetical protein